MRHALKQRGEAPIMWVVPFSFLVLVIVVAATDRAFPFLPWQVSDRTWIWAASGIVGASVAAYLTEFLGSDSRRVLLSMGSTAVASLLAFGYFEGFFQRTIVTAVQGVVPNSLVGGAVYASFLTIVPGALMGATFGGLVGLSSSLSEGKVEEAIGTPRPQVTADQWPGYEKACGRCGHVAPFESSYCPYCGVELERRRAPQVKFCRFCGSRIYFIGKFCPDCGREIDTISKREVYVSQ